MSEAADVYSKENRAQPSRQANKRKAEDTAQLVEGKTKKRSVLTDLTNAIAKPFLAANKKLGGPSKKLKLAAAAAQNKGKCVAAEDNIGTALPALPESPEKEETLETPKENKEEVDENEAIIDIDENCSDLYSEPQYAKDIFNYYRSKEVQLMVQPYMEKQPEVTAGMRAILVDWMVEVQENLELNHETLYLAVRLVDLFLSICSTPKARLQLLGATAVVVAAKYDERSPPPVEEFLYICDDAYSKQEMLKMEQRILFAVGFQLGMPLSYRFLRRFARCNRETTVTLTLARYLLELSLMNYDLNVGLLESKKAATTLFLARLLQDLTPAWPRNLVHHTGYEVRDFAALLEPFHRPLAHPSNSLLVVRHKYIHPCFYEVAKTPPLTPEVLQQYISSS